MKRIALHLNAALPIWVGMQAAQTNSPLLWPSFQSTSTSSFLPDYFPLGSVNTWSRCKEDKLLRFFCDFFGAMRHIYPDYSLNISLPLPPSGWISFPWQRSQILCCCCNPTQREGTHFIFEKLHSALLLLLLQHLLLLLCKIQFMQSCHSICPGHFESCIKYERILNRVFGKSSSQTTTKHQAALWKLHWVGRVVWAAIPSFHLSKVASVSAPAATAL